MDKPAGVLMFLLVILKVLGTAEADCSSTCSATSCTCTGQDLTSVPQDLPTTITWLDLRRNQITTLSQSDFSRYRSLEDLRLDYNSISTINSQAFYHLSNLTELWLDSNRITALRSDMFTGLGNLQYLYLFHNSISDIQDGTFNSTPQLTRLYLSNNRLTKLRANMFTGLGNLQTLDLYDNDITVIPDHTFNPTPQLKFLNLSNNHIQSIASNLLANLLNLTEVSLSDNSITAFPFEDLLNIQTIVTLHLDKNQMTTIPSTAYDILSSISEVNIDNNPWQCDCRMVEFRLKMTGTYPFENQIICFQPDSVHGQKLIDISPEDLMSYCEEPTIVRFEQSEDNPLIEGDSLRLVCEATGIPTPDITVTLPSGLNATVDSVGKVTVDVNGTIMIRDVTVEDSGQYVCTATNSVGFTRSVSIDVFYPNPPPTFSLGVIVGTVGVSFPPIRDLRRHAISS
ncbi:PREDICTED: chondroadherin-like [Branchiostoma belcheri]|uniref:Chondroadherin-like n=1 Tax=Branchiostoma belcheri TaxID=7741 RepID=A0A6P4YPG8_BRABE|nr:PREDICTED: chondroadherin-like [Branchiostoma belcheri]